MTLCDTLKRYLVTTAYERRMLAVDEAFKLDDPYRVPVVVEEMAPSQRELNDSIDDYFAHGSHVQDFRTVEKRRRDKEIRLREEASKVSAEVSKRQPDYRAIAWNALVHAVNLPSRIGLGNFTVHVSSDGWFDKYLKPSYRLR